MLGMDGIGSASSIVGPSVAEPRRVCSFTPAGLPTDYLPLSTKCAPSWHATGECGAGGTDRSRGGTVAQALHRNGAKESSTAHRRRVIREGSLAATRDRPHRAADYLVEYESCRPALRHFERRAPCPTNPRAPPRAIVAPSPHLVRPTPLRSKAVADSLMSSSRVRQWIPLRGQHILGRARYGACSM